MPGPVPVPVAARAALLASAAGIAAVAGARALGRVLLPRGVPNPPPAPLGSAFDPADLSAARRYRRGTRILQIAGMPVGPALLTAAVRTRPVWGPALAGAVGGRSWLAGAVLGAGGSLGGRAAGMPLSAARYAWGRRNGLVTQPVGPWLADVGKATALETAFSAGMGAAAAGLMRRAPRTWWVAMAGVTGAAGLVLSVLAPVLIEPLFQKTRPLDDPGLERDVLDVAERVGVPARRVLVNDASTRTTAANAYVSGLAASRRVVLFDTLLRDFPRDQVRFVVAHEMAHVARRHVMRLAVWSAAMSLPVALAAYAAVGWRTGFAAAPAGAAGTGVVLHRLVVAAAAGGAVAGLSGPFAAWVSRHYEREAEWTALRATGDPDAAIGLQQGIVRRNLSVPDPPRWAQLWGGTHPTALERVAMAELARERR